MRALLVPTHPLRLLARAAALVAAWKKRLARRRLVGQMTGLDDHMLRDIGVTRAELYASLAAGFDDPTLKLATWAHEARASRRAQALEQRQWAAMMGDAEAGSEIWDRRAA